MLLRMYGLDVGADVSELTGCLLESIDVAQHQVQLRFDSLNGITLRIESDFSLTPAAGETTRCDRPPAAAQALADRLGVEVVGAEMSTPGT